MYAEIKNLKLLSSNTNKNNENNQLLVINLRTAETNARTFNANFLSIFYCFINFIEQKSGTLNEKAYFGNVERSSTNRKLRPTC